MREHTELRSIPDDTSLYRILARLDPAAVARVMDEIVRRISRRWRSSVTVTVDVTGLAQNAVSSYFIRRIEHFCQPQRTWKHWLK